MHLEKKICIQAVLACIIYIYLICVCSLPRKKIQKIFLRLSSQFNLSTEVSHVHAEQKFSPVKLNGCSGLQPDHLAADVKLRIGPTYVVIKADHYQLKMPWLVQIPFIFLNALVSDQYSLWQTHQYKVIRIRKRKMVSEHLPYNYISISYRPDKGVLVLE